MSDSWIYGRNPSAWIRYRHGGFNALYPLHCHEVQTRIFTTVNAETIAVSPNTPSDSDPDNILAFPARKNRHGRPGLRDRKGNSR